MSGGVRFAHAFENEGGEPSNYGWGPVVGVELYRPVRNCLSIYGSGRYSMMFGHAFGGIDGSVPFNVTEVQLGLQWTRGQCFARAGYESQYWEMVTESNGYDLGLNGGVFSVGFVR